MEGGLIRGKQIEIHLEDYDQNCKALFRCVCTKMERSHWV